jgi:hypothetical protein
MFGARIFPKGGQLANISDRGRGSSQRGQKHNCQAPGSPTRRHLSPRRSSRARSGPNCSAPPATWALRAWCQSIAGAAIALVAARTGLKSSTLSIQPIDGCKIKRSQHWNHLFDDWRTAKLCSTTLNHLRSKDLRLKPINESNACARPRLASLASPSPPRARCTKTITAATKALARWPTNSWSRLPSLRATQTTKLAASARSGGMLELTGEQFFGNSAPAGAVLSLPGVPFDGRAGSARSASTRHHVRHMPLVTRWLKVRRKPHGS